MNRRRGAVVFATLLASCTPKLAPRSREVPVPPKAVLADRDRDGVADGVDACPDVLGVRTDDSATNGCPPDTDGDGVDDLADACPTVPGVATSDPSTHGCPDRDPDKDGAFGPDDACPTDRGPSDADPRRNGCPAARLVGARIETLDPVAFSSGATLEASAANEAVLTAILGVVLKLPETTRVRIEGHTDNRGDAFAAKRLALARAVAVAKWLTHHGIDASRLPVVGVGPDRPIATNETEFGRAANRRLELHLEPDVSREP
jgi:outer membrane protein OmpA-like peptidoglycan-associated protein